MSTKIEFCFSSLFTGEGGLEIDSPEGFAEIRTEMPRS